MEILNHKMITLFKFLGLIQLTLFVFLFICVLSYRIYQDRQYLNNKKLKVKVAKILHKTNLSNSEKDFLSKNITLAIYLFHDMELKNQFPSRETPQILLSDYFISYIPKLFDAKYWYYRQLACYLLYLKAKYLSISKIEQAYLAKLLDDDIPIVTLNAALAVSLVPNEKLVNQLIDIFTEERRVQYDLFRIILFEANLKMVEMIVQRLTLETNNRVRGLCYRMLIDLPKINIEIPSLLHDIKSDYLDLSLSALAFAVYARKPNFSEILMKAISSPIWQMRARAAKLVGKNCDGSFAWVLEPLLNDENVWVRFRAAEGLINLGKIGIDLLKETSFPQAIELAKQQLMLMDKRNEEKR